MLGKFHPFSQTFFHHHSLRNDFCEMSGWISPFSPRKKTPPNFKKQPEWVDVALLLFGIASTTLMHHSSQISRNLSGWRSPMITTDATEERMWPSLCWEVTLWFNTYIAIVKVTSTRLQLSLIFATNPSGKWCPMISADVTSSTFPHLLQSVRQNLLHESDHCTWR